MSTLRVGPSRTYTTINSAISAAPGNGDLILIDPGTYNEAVVVNKWVNLLANTSTPENGDVYIYGGGSTTLTINYLPASREDIYIEGIKMSRSTVNWQVVFLIAGSGSNANLGIYLNRCTFIAGTNVYPVDLNNNLLYDFKIENCYIQRGYSHVLYANWGNITTGGFITNTQLNNTYYCYLCTGSPTTLDVVTTATTDYGPAYGSYYNSYTPPTLDISGWANKIVLTIDNTKVDSNLMDFPVLVTLASGTGQNTYDATPVFDELISISGTKNIAITDINDTPLYVEIESWDWTNEIANLWVKVPSVSSVSGTVLNLYYDATVSGNVDYVGYTGETPAMEVWGYGYLAVWHMEQDPSAGANSILDSTYSLRHLSPNGAMDSNDLIDGFIGKAIDFDGNNDYLSRTYISQLNSADHTIEVFFNIPNVTNVPTFFHQGDYAVSSNQGWRLNAINDVNGGIRLNWYNSAWYSVYSDTNVPVGEDAAIAFGYDHSEKDAYFWINGNLDPVEAMTTTLYNTTYSLKVGATKGASLQNYFLGSISEYRISSILRPDAWVKATYYSNLNNLISFETYVPPPPPPVIYGNVNIWAIGDYVFKTLASGVGVYDLMSEALLGEIYYTMGNTGPIWANNDYLYMASWNAGVLRYPMDSVASGIYDGGFATYKAYPDINNNRVNYIHGAGKYLNVATISGTHIFDLTTGSGVYSDTSIAGTKCYQMADRTAYYIYDDKLETVYNDDTTYIYTSGDGIIPTISGMNDVHVVSGTKNLILLATTDGAVVIEENKGSEASSRFKYYYIEE